MSDVLRSGTANGLFEFCDYLVDKGYGGQSAVSALKSAARAVFERVDGPNYGDTKVSEIDANDYSERFATKALGEMKAESIEAYKKRFIRAVAYYNEFLADGTVPKFRTGGSRNGAPSTGPNRNDRQPAPPEPVVAATANEERLIDYPFPLRSGEIAVLRLPQKLERSDAQRISSFVSTLVFDPLPELESGEARDE